MKSPNELKESSHRLKRQEKSNSFSGFFRCSGGSPVHRSREKKFGVGFKHTMVVHDNIRDLYRSVGVYGVLNHNKLWMRRSGCGDRINRRFRFHSASPVDTLLHVTLVLAAETTTVLIYVYPSAVY
jgi:hypothetical protein